jgi:hypothetical protein
MILFTLKCASDHEFEAWFRDNAAYDRQEARSLITCPDCGSNAVEKAPMAPRVQRSRSRTEPAPPAKAETDVKAEADVKAETKTVDLPVSPAQLRRMLQEVRRHVEANCENVGDRFADEARRIHRGEADARGIYGEASDQQANDLADEGIEVARIPWVPPSDA